MCLNCLQAEPHAKGLSWAERMQLISSYPLTQGVTAMRITRCVTGHVQATAEPLFRHILTLLTLHIECFLCGYIIMIGQ